MWVNPAAEHYFQSAKFILTGTFCFMFVAFGIRLKFEGDRSTQILLLAVGVSGVFSANPIGFFLWRDSHIRVTDHFFTALFVTLYRLFLVFELSRAKKAAVFLLVYGVVDGFATFWRKHLLFEPKLEDARSLLRSEQILMGFHIVYAIAAAVCIANHKRASARTLFCVIAVAVTTGMACVSHAAANQLVTQLLCYSAHVTMAALTLFLYQTDSDGKQWEEPGSWVGGELLDSAAA
jgi:hypothetical protein